MARRVFLHVGTMKSATSYLQSLCQLNRSTLEEAGIHWPGLKANFSAARDFYVSRREPGDKGAWRTMRKAVRQHRGDVLISNELLARRGAKQARDLVKALRPAEVRVVITARDFGRVIPSLWQTQMRNRGTATWAQFVAAVYENPPTSDLAERFFRGQYLPDIVRRWSAAVPVENITVVTVPPPGADPVEVARRFFSVVAPDLGELKQPAYRNESLGAHSAELLRRVNQLTTDMDYVHYRPALKVEVSRNILGRRTAAEPKLGLTTEQLKRATELSQDMVTELAATGVRVVGDLADLIPAASLRPTDVDPDASTDSEVLAAATFALAELSRAYADLKLAEERRRTG